MSKIPEDVMIAAKALVPCYTKQRGCHHTDDYSCEDGCERLASVTSGIMAERERCAATIEAIGSDTDPQLADHLANCLRNPPQSPPLLSQEEAFQRAVKAGLFAGLVSKPEDTTL